jgi:hypothetical protein
MTNPFLDRAAKQAAGAHGVKSEARIAKSLAARLQPASGAMRGAKGDMQIESKHKVLLEAKSTVNATMSLDLGWLVKINHEAMGKGSMPALSISFVTPEGKAKPGGEWAMVPMHYFKELIGE